MIFVNPNSARDIARLLAETIGRPDAITDAQRLAFTQVLGNGGAAFSPEMGVRVPPVGRENGFMVQSDLQGTIVPQTTIQDVIEAYNARMAEWIVYEGPEPTLDMKT